MNQSLSEALPLSPINPEIISVIQEVFWDTLEDVWYFWSRTRGENGRYSDIDFAIIVNGEEWIDWRESNSPKIKQMMAERGIRELGAFNIYNQRDINKIPIWFKSIIGRNLEPILWSGKSLWLLKVPTYKGIPGMRRAWTFNSLWAEENHLISRIASLSWFMQQRGAHLNLFPDMVRFYELEILRLEEMRELLRSGIFVSSFPSFSDALRLRWGHEISLEVQKRDLEYRMLFERLFYAYENVDLHIQVSEQLESTDTIWALQHLLSACHIEMRKCLHGKWFYIVDGEVTQSYLQHMRTIYTPGQLEEFYAVLFKAEQICGRADLVTFDFDNNGPVYAENTSQEILQSIIWHLRESFNRIRESHQRLVHADCITDLEISIAPVCTNNILIGEVKSRISKLIIPFGKIEFITSPNVDTGIKGEQCPIINEYHEVAKVARGKYIFFVENSVEISPLALLRLLWKMNSDSIGMVTPTVQWILLEHHSRRHFESVPLQTHCSLVNTKLMCTLLESSVDSETLSDRMSQAGHGVLHEPRAVIFKSFL